MPGPLPKDPATRARRNKATTRTTLPSVEEAATNKVPALYKRERASEKWHPRVVAWWKAVWKSPMASEWLAAEVVGLAYRLAELLQAFWSTDDPELRVKLETKIDAAEAKLGLSPIDRRRLQWEIEKGEQADERTSRRRQVKQASSKDPRESLRVMS